MNRDLIREEVIKRVSQERQTDLAIINAVKQEIRGHSEEDNINFGQVNKRLDEHSKKLEKLSNKIVIHLESQQKLDKEQIEHNVKSEAMLSQILAEAKKTNGRVTKLEDTTNKLDHDNDKTMVAVSGFYERFDKQDKSHAETMRMWKERGIWLISVLILGIIAMLFKSQGVDIEELAEVTNNIPE